MSGVALTEIAHVLGAFALAILWGAVVFYVFVRFLRLWPEHGIPYFPKRTSDYFNPLWQVRYMTGAFLKDLGQVLLMKVGLFAFAFLVLTPLFESLPEQSQIGN